MLSGLPTYAPAVRAVSGLEGVDAYLRQRGESRVPSDRRECADAALRTFLSLLYADRSEFAFDPDRFEPAYDELEQALYEGRAVTTVVAPLLGIALHRETTEVALGDGLSLVRGDTLDDAPPDAVWGDAEEPQVLIVLAVAQDRASPVPVSVARVRFRRTLTALRLFEPGGFALGPVAWTRIDAGSWRSVPLGGSGRPRLTRRIPVEQEDELRAFCNLVARRTSRGGEAAWALSRFEMGCERLAPFEALSDYLLALRALLEPEGPASGRLAGRLAAICAKPEDRAEVAERTAHAIPARARGDRRTGPGRARRRRARRRAVRACARCSGTCCAGISTPICARSRTSCWPKRPPERRLPPAAPPALGLSADRSLLGLTCGAGSVLPPGSTCKSWGSNAVRGSAISASSGRSARSCCFWRPSRFGVLMGRVGGYAPTRATCCCRARRRTQRSPEVPEHAADQRRRLRGALPPRHRGGPGHRAVRQGRERLPLGSALASMRGLLAPRSSRR